jgi:cysteine desulfurase/selenocysteine lyase
LVPDTALISQWANQFFSILPGKNPDASSTWAVPVDLVPAQVGPSAVSPISAPSSPDPRPLAESPRSLSPFSADPSPSGLDQSLFSFPSVSDQPAKEGPAEAVTTEESKGKLFFPTDSYSFLPVIVSEDSNRSTHPAFDAAWFKKDFPILQQKVNGKPLIWLDNAATTQKPKQVIDRLTYFYENENSNVHRAAHVLAARATDAYEGAREKVKRFLGASSAKEIVFVRGATEAINLVAKAWGDQHINEGDEIVITWLEHHANIVPWQQLCARKGAKLRVAPVDDHGQVIISEYERLFNSRTKLASVTQVSNALGTVVPVEKLVEIAHRHGAKVLVDGAQAVSHQRVNVAELDTDFYVFSGHKVFGPTGIGVLYGKEELLNATQPWQGGGNMIADVTFEKTIYQSSPARFEAGTGNIADAVGLGEALDYLQKVGLENVARHEHELLVYGTELLKRVRGLRFIGTAPEKAGVLSFVVDGHKNEDIGAALNREGIAVRSGHHCAQPILRRFGVEGTVRASLAFYNLPEDVEALARVLCDLTGGSKTREVKG